MGCGGSRAAEEKYTITYSKATPSSSTDDDSSNSNSNSNSLTAAQSAFTQRSSHVSKMQPAPNSRKSMSSIAAEPSAASALLKSSVKRKFGTSVKKISANNAFAKAGARRNTRSKRKKTSQYGWLAKDMHIGPGCTFAKFDVKRVIGTGLMGQVVLAEWKKDETWCAIKCVKKDYICRHDDGRHIQAERKLLENADSPFICSMFGTFQDKVFCYFVLEYAAGGELFSRLHNKKGKFGVQTSKFYLIEILLALEHVQSLGFAYRDLKPENIMLDEEGHCKLVDFGFSAQPDKNGLLHTNVGTPAYLSPEQLNHKKTGGYKMHVDWWAFGIIIFELLTGTTPFCKSHKESSYAIYIRVLKGKIKFPGYFDNSVKDLVKQLLTADEEKRTKDVKSIKESAYFKEVEWEKVLSRELVPPYVPKLKEEGDAHYFDQYAELNKSEKDPRKIDHTVFHGF